ncbi:type I polyketide synthase [Ectobacillus panaciterrae]|uniref:type I polyketide synthase n=1 Tax=Ectobacillus panaciterrae TaxID=363872 RepID=UPI0004109E9C|nr:type I polyketide synthase [Ectobacillus panaciterrae]
MNFHTIADEKVRNDKVVTEDAIRDWLISEISTRLEILKEEIDLEEPFVNFGLDSAEAVVLSGDLSEWLDQKLSPTIVWDYPTIESLSRYLVENSHKQFTNAFSAASSEEPIAIVGLASRFPGASNETEFWNLLKKGIDAISEIPRDRWDNEVFYDKDLDAPGKMTTKWGGFIKDIDCFDASFFNITPREADCMDPQQRILLEVAWEAIENSGYSPSELAKSLTGVFIGISTNDYSRLQIANSSDVDAYTAIGNATNMAANRLSYFFDFKGPSVAVDTACSSSLVAVHLSCQSLRNGECNIALVGGANVILSPEVSVSFSKARMMSPVGRCKTFDDKADGYVRGEGAGVLVLKRLSDALKDGDTILSVIRGSAVNQDGKSNGITAPNGKSQEIVIQQALKNAGVEPSKISYVEAHGTGTPLGDPIEMEALKNVLIQGRSTNQPCAIGSVKTNIGHLEAAAGIAGLIKVVLSLTNEEIPPHLHFEKLNPHISLADSKLFIPTSLQRWPSGKIRRFAGVSSFGFGGTNAHVVLEEAPTQTEERDTKDKASFDIVTLSARNEVALQKLASRYNKYLLDNSKYCLSDISYTANVGREDFSHRMAVVADSTVNLREQIGQFLSGKPVDGLRCGKVDSKHPAKIAFLFTGQGSQYHAMGRQLYHTQLTFRHALDKCNEILRDILPVSLLSLLFDSNYEDLLNQTMYSQPALFSLEYSLFEMWKTWGIMPDAVLGHSVGEYVAACISGVYSLEDGLKLIAERGRLMQALPRNGMMAVVRADITKVSGVIGQYQNSISIAAINGPTNVVISGNANLIEQAIRELENEGITCKPLNVSHAFHSHLMNPILDKFQAAAESIQFGNPKIPLVSNQDGRILSSNDSMGSEYWTRHIVEPVNFMAGVHTLMNQGITCFVELGPNPVLINMARQIRNDDSCAWLSSLNHNADDWKVVLSTLGKLYTLGMKINWESFYSNDIRRFRIPLPTYPFDKTRHWFTSKALMGKINHSSSNEFLWTSTNVSNKEESEVISDNMNTIQSDLIAILKNQSQVLVEQSKALMERNNSINSTTPYNVHEETRLEERQNFPSTSNYIRLKVPQEPSSKGNENITSVLNIISKISGYPVSELHLDQSLVNELGFDSLMLVQLRNDLASKFPHVTYDFEHFIGEITIKGIIDLLDDDSTVAAVQKATNHIDEPATDNISKESTPIPANKIPEENYRIELFPEYLHLEQRLKMSESINPYFAIRDGVNKDVITMNERQVINFSSYNYLGLSGDSIVSRAAINAIERYGTSVSASRLLSGEIPLHHELEQELADFIGVESSIVYSAGHATNVTTIGHIVGPGDLILHDELCHNSIIQGCILSGAQRRPFPHNDWMSVDKLLNKLRSQYKRVLIIIEGIYSMDGDIPELLAFLEVKTKHKALLFIDEAHSIGVLGATGKGICEHFDIDPSHVDILMGSISKSFASCGGYIAGSKQLIQYLKYTAPGFIFSAGITPANTAAALAALRVICSEPERISKLNQMSNLFAKLAREHGLDIGLHDNTPVIPVILGDSEKCLRVTEALLKQGINVYPIVYPAVPEHAARLRFFVTSNHTEEQIKFAVNVTAKELNILTGQLV